MDDAKPREWGDGATDAREHVIEDMSYSAGVIACRCGSRVVGAMPDELADAWVAHGGQVLRLTDAVERGTEPLLPAHARAEAARAAIITLGARCTCATTDITDCPNYVAGDEVPDHDE